MTDQSRLDPALRRAMARPVLLTVLVLAVVLGGLFLWRTLRSAPDQNSSNAPLSVAAMVVQARDAPDSLESVGTVRAVQQVTLSPEVAGRVSQIRFEAGQHVSKGALLVQLFDGPERADRQAAMAKAAFAKVQLERSEKLAPTGAESREVLEQNRSQYAQALAAVHQIDARIVQKQVRAPFSGTIGIRKADLGQYLNPGDAVATLTALDRLFVDFSLPQQKFGQLKRGARVTVTSDAWPERRFTARVSAIEPQVGEDTRNIALRATMANPGQALRPGMYVTASLVLPAQPGALIVPATAIQTSAHGGSVIVIRGKNASKGGTAAVVPVRTGRRIGDNVVVTKGLKAGDVIVTEGQLRVRPGAEVTVAQSPVKAKDAGPAGTR